MDETQPVENSAPQGGLSHVPDNEMSPYDIIKEDIKKFNLDLNPDNVYAALLEMTKQPNHRIVRSHNTLGVIDNLGNGVADAVIYTADNAPTFIKSLKELTAGMKAGGFHLITVPSSGIAIEKLMKRAGLNFKMTAVTENGQEGHKIKITL
jgi:hypothetical protein